MMRPGRFSALVLTGALALLLAGCATRDAVRTTAVPEGASAQLTLLETSDLHANVLSFDYFRAQEDPTLGFERAATLVRRARAEFTNTLLFDAGDTIQGTVLADWQAQVEPLGCEEELAVYRAMDHLGYDGATAGNHEFNYGLQFLSQVTGTPFRVAGVDGSRCHGPGFPIVLANVFSTRDGEPLYSPWTVIRRTIHATAPDGSSIEAPLRVGLIGFTPPRIMDWDRRYLEGRVRVMGVVEAAERYLPQLLAERPDVVVAIIHGGPSTAPYTATLDNAVSYLARVPGLDAIMMGHAHQLFPGPRYAEMPGVDNKRGTVHGVPAVMPSMFGKAIGLVHLELAWHDGRWHSAAARARSETWSICDAAGHCVDPDPAIATIVADAHAGALAYVNTPIGRSDFPLRSHFADLGDPSALAPVHAAQRAWALAEIRRDHPELAGIPVLSAAAAFRTGFAGPEDYTDVPAGPLTIRSAADLYFYPNTIAAVRVNGAELKGWLEQAAGRFNRIDPAATQPQPLVSARFPGYNFDQLSGPGLQYVIDVSRPRGERITALTVDGQPVAPDAPFIIVTNNYRANGGGQFPGMDGSRTVLESTRGNREVLIDWLRAAGALHGADLLRRHWHFAPLATHGPVTMTAPPDSAAGIPGVRPLGPAPNGMETWAVDLHAAANTP